MKSLEKLSIVVGATQVVSFLINYLLNPGFNNSLSGANWFGGIVLLLAPVNLVIFIICLFKHQKYAWLGTALTVLAMGLVLGLHWNINIAPGNDF